MTNMRKLTSKFMPKEKHKTGEHKFCFKCHRDGQRCRCETEVAKSDNQEVGQG